MIHLQVGALPWLGNRHAEMVEELHFHDLPLITVAEQDGKPYLCRCVVGEVEDVNVWTYTPLTAADLAAIDEATPETFDDVVVTMARERSTHVAVAFQGYGIVAWTEWDEFDEPQEAVNVLAGRMAEFIANLQEGADAAKVKAERLLERV